MTTRELSPGLQARVLDQSDVRRLLPARDPYAHKGDFGRVLLLCGSMGYTGAAALAARAALRCGSGLTPWPVTAAAGCARRQRTRSMPTWRPPTAA